MICVLNRNFWMFGEWGKKIINWREIFVVLSMGGGCSWSSGKRQWNARFKRSAIAGTGPASLSLSSCNRTEQHCEKKKRSEETVGGFNNCHFCKTLFEPTIERKKPVDVGLLLMNEDCCWRRGRISKRCGGACSFHLLRKKTKTTQLCRWWWQLRMTIGSQL